MKGISSFDAFRFPLDRRECRPGKRNGTDNASDGDGSADDLFRFVPVHEEGLGKEGLTALAGGEIPGDDGPATGAVGRVSGKGVCLCFDGDIPVMTIGSCSGVAWWTFGPVNVLRFRVNVVGMGAGREEGPAIAFSWDGADSCSCLDSNGG